MGLDNFFQNSKNEPVNYTGEPLTAFVCASMGMPEQGAWRGKYYFPIIQAMLGLELENPRDYEDLWLFNEHTANEIKEAYLKFASFDLKDHNVWSALMTTASKYDFYGYVSEYTVEEIEEIVKYFKFYSQVEDVKLVAWY